jgi:hypothetical protein
LRGGFFAAAAASVEKIKVTERGVPYIDFVKIIVMRNIVNLTIGGIKTGIFEKDNDAGIFLVIYE